VYVLLKLKPLEMCHTQNKSGKVCLGYGYFPDAFFAILRASRMLVLFTADRYVLLQT
jgi:hypothetical protein